MNEIQYKELNNYLNELFIYLQDYYEPFLDYILPIFVLNDGYVDLLKDYNLRDNSINNNLTFNEIYETARKIVVAINTKYLPLFDNLIKSGELDFSYDCKYYDSHFTHTPKYSAININRSYNYDDVVTLIHEFFHYVSGHGDYVTKNWHWLTEFFSIYFETYSIDFLSKSNILDKEIDYKCRLRATYNLTRSIYFFESPILAYNFFGLLNDNSFRMLSKFDIVNVNKEDFIYECTRLLDWFKETEKDYKQEHFKDDYDVYELRMYYGHKFKDYFNYFIGTILAFYARKYCSIEDIIRINDNINDTNLDIIDCLNEIGIDIYDEEFKNKVIESINEYITDYSIEKEESCKKNILVKV